MLGGAIFLSLAVWAAEGTSNAEAMSMARSVAALSMLETESGLVRPVETPFTVHQGPVTLTLDHGFLVPVFSGFYAQAWADRGQDWLRDRAVQGKAELDLPTAEERGSREMVGFVWIGKDADLAVRLDDRADALLFATRMVRDLGYDVEKFRPVVRDQVFHTTTDVALLLGIDPALRQAFLSASEDEADDSDAEAAVYEIVVYGDAGPARAAARKAKRLLEERLELWYEMRVDFGQWIARDRVAETRGFGSAMGFSTAMDFHTSHRYGRFSPASDAPADHWLSAVRQEQGLYDNRRLWSVVTVGKRAGQVQRGLIGGVPYPPSDPEDPTSAPAPPARVEPTTAWARVYVQHAASAADVAVEVQAKLTLRGAGQPVGMLDLVLPRVESSPGTWEVLDLRDGQGRSVLAPIDRPETLSRKQRTIEPRPGPDEPPKPKPTSAESVYAGEFITVMLPEPLLPGEELTLHLRYRDTWGVVNTSNVASGSGTIQVDQGRSTLPHRVLPAVRGDHSGAGWTADLSVAIDPALRMSTAVTGRTVEQWEEDGFLWTRAKTEGHAVFPDIAVGRWKTHVEPPSHGLPGVRVHMYAQHARSLKTFGPETRRVVGYYQRWLPRFPVSEVEIFDAPGRIDGYVWIAPHGMVSISQAMATDINTGLRKGKPHLENGIYAHELAHQYWGHLAPPASIDDFWIAETMAEGFSCMYLGAAFDPKDCMTRMKFSRRYWEKEHRHYAWTEPSLTSAYRRRAQPKIVYQYGPYVMQEMLRRRIGTNTYFGALRALLEDHPRQPLTTERLERYLSTAADQDLGDFFDYWIYAGLMPKLDMVWHVQGGSYRATVRADTPFGRFYVALQVRSTAGEEELVWVEVVDGVGSVEGKMEGAHSVDYDKQNTGLARRRSSKRVKTPAEARP